MDTTNLKKCDIVMKGGITSGIVYPHVVCGLAAHYQFQSIGGTSAGAIAAALTAAAEHGRWQGRDAFAELAAIPDWLGADAPVGGGSNLFHLFQPQARMRGLFRFATGFLVGGGARLRAWASVLWLEILLGVLPGAALLWLASSNQGWRLALAVGLAILVALAGIAITAVAGLVARAARLPSHYFGLCTGYGDPGDAEPPSLVAWLSRKLNELAGLPAERPLTFGDLKEARVTLRMITTCLTFGRPFTLPFESAGELYYSPQEMRRFFPPEVVTWMERRPATPSDHSEPVAAGELVPLPAGDDLPVIVAARLSLSFPVLFCAVPLYAVDWTRRRLARGEARLGARVPGDALDPEEIRKPEPVWFSDGGICSNFPLHLFDSPLPQWPAFAVNLGKVRPDRSGRVWMPTSNGSGISDLWTRLATRAGIAAAGALLPAIFDAAQNWQENLQASAPGYRDRIVHLYLDPHEGGLKLNMPRSVVATLAGYGREAAQRLVDHFVNGTDGDQPTPMTWDNHRWIRCRSSLAVLEVFLGDFACSLAHPEPGDRSYFELISRDADTPPKSYRLKDQQQGAAGKFMNAIGAAGAASSQGLLEKGAPRPTPALGIRPRF